MPEDINGTKVAAGKRVFNHFRQAKGSVVLKEGNLEVHYDDGRVDDVSFCHSLEVLNAKEETKEETAKILRAKSKRKKHCRAYIGSNDEPCQTCGWTYLQHFKRQK